MSQPQKVIAVLGAGEMGRKISALCAANKNVKKVLLYDLDKKIAIKAIETAITETIGGKPIHSLPDIRHAKKILAFSTQNNEDLKALTTADIVIEAATEHLPWKIKLFKSIMPHIRKNILVATNTSGITLKDMTEDLPEWFCQILCVWHFFNPPRMMSLVEVVLSDKNPKHFKEISEEILVDQLGKNIVFCPDTPNFLANRIGLATLFDIIERATKSGIPISKVDKLTGPIIGKPQMGTFRLADFVGNATIQHVGENFLTKCKEDTLVKSGKMQVPACIPFVVETLNKVTEQTKGLSKKALQEKLVKIALAQGYITKEELDYIKSQPNLNSPKVKFSGFYIIISAGDPMDAKKSFRKKWELDLQSLKYVQSPKFESEAYKIAKKTTKLPDGQMRRICYQDSPDSKFVWEVMAANLLYCATIAQNMALKLPNIDNSMKWGYNWSAGPFESWDILGVEKSVERMQEEGKQIPRWVLKMLKSGINSFYKESFGIRYHYDLKTKSYEKEIPNPKRINLRTLKKKGAIVQTGEKIALENWGSRVLDLGDGIACLELDSKIVPNYNPIDGSVISMMHQVRQCVEEDFQALVISTAADNFSVGAQVAMILELCKRKEWNFIHDIAEQFQMACMSMKYASFPVIAAPRELALGGGCEIMMSSNKVVAPVNLYTGLVEAGVGVVPAGGGCKCLLSNLMDKLAHKTPGPFQATQIAFETIGMGQMAFSAPQAKTMGFLRKDDIIIPTAETLIWEAKKQALLLAKKYQPAEPKTNMLLPGNSGFNALKAGIDGFYKTGLLTEYERDWIGLQLAYILSGGKKASYTEPISEYDILAMERKAFVQLCKQPKTQERMAYILKNNKPLRN